MHSIYYKREVDATRYLYEVNFRNILYTASSVRVGLIYIKDLCIKVRIYAKIIITIMHRFFRVIKW